MKTLFALILLLMSTNILAEDSYIVGYDKETHSVTISYDVTCKPSLWRKTVYLLDEKNDVVGDIDPWHNKLVKSAIIEK